MLGPKPQNTGASSVMHRFCDIRGNTASDKAANIGEYLPQQTCGMHTTLVFLTKNNCLLFFFNRQFSVRYMT